MSAPMPVGWHTWSGRLHKFGPLQQSSVAWGSPFCVAECNRSIVTDEHTQQATKQKSVCKRCFPGGVQ